MEQHTDYWQVRRKNVVFTPPTPRDIPVWDIGVWFKAKTNISANGDLCVNINTPERPDGINLHPHELRAVAGVCLEAAEWLEENTN